MKKHCLPFSAWAFAALGTVLSLLPACASASASTGVGTQSDWLVWPPAIAQLRAGPSESSVAARLPSDVQIQRPDAEAVGPQRTRWSGIWRGWACFAAQCDVQVAVEKLSAEGATVAYTGASAVQQISERGQAEFVGNELRMQLRNGSTLVLRLREDGDMEMSLWSAAAIKQLMSFGVLTQKPFAYSRTVERVPTPWVEVGHAQTLEMVVYRPPGKGPFPTLVFNHGSTGEGDKPEWFVLTWTSTEVGRFFADQGWQVVFPQRRGRGKSDGLYDEGFEPDRSRYACKAELSLPGLERAMSDLDAVMAYLRTRPDVDMQRLLIGGVSRGGILSATYAGTRTDIPFLGVVNFVGGWVGDRCADADKVNAVSFQRSAAFARPMLWLYGEHDSFYSLQHSRKNFDAFIAAGGKGRFESFAPPPGVDWHFIHMQPELWERSVKAYLQTIGTVSSTPATLAESTKRMRD